jgi:aldose 1-epimerase
MELRRDAFGTGKDGEPVWLYRLANGRGVEIELVSWGATLVRWRAPDRDGRSGDVVLGFDALAPYLARHPHMGSTVGRCANRIGGARFALDGVEHRLTPNIAPHHLHGGTRGFHDVAWEAEELRSDRSVGVRFRYRSRDGEEGYPGNVEASATHVLDERGALTIDFSATTDRPTLVNLAHHSYFNLADGGATDVRDHELWLAADAYTPLGPGLIPTGEIAPVRGTPLDFTAPRRVGDRIDAVGDEPRGYDHNYVLRGARGTLRLVARVRDPRSGRVLEVGSTEPGLQLYTGNFLDGTLVGRGGARYCRHAGLCLETQTFPDSPHHAHFPQAVLRPGETYRHRVVYRVSAS